MATNTACVVVASVCTVCWLLVTRRVGAFPTKTAVPGYDKQKKGIGSVGDSGDGYGLRGFSGSEEFDFPEDRIIDLAPVAYPEPECSYAVKSVSSHGPVVSGVRVGDPLYHQWRCYTVGTPHSELYCMVVRNCTVGNDRVSYPIIDADGCTLEPSIVPDVTYESDLNGGIYASAFSLGYNEPTLAFSCTIKLLIKENGRCVRPDCSKRRH